MLLFQAFRKAFKDNLVAKIPLNLWMLSTIHFKKGGGFIFAFFMWQQNSLINGRYLDLIANRELLVKQCIHFFWESKHIIYEKL